MAAVPEPVSWEVPPKQATNEPEIVAPPGVHVNVVPEAGFVVLLKQTVELFAVPALTPNQPVAPHAKVTLFTLVGKMLFAPFKPICGWFVFATPAV